MIILPKYKHLATVDVLQDTAFHDNFHRKSSAKKGYKTQRKHLTERGYTGMTHLAQNALIETYMFCKIHYIGTKSYHACAELLAIMLQRFSDVF